MMVSNASGRKTQKIHITDHTKGNVIFCVGEQAAYVKENIVMHEKVNRRIVEEAVPLLTEIVKEGISQGMLSCNNIEERVKMLLIISQHTFDDGDFGDRDVEVYIDTVEKTFGAEAGTMNFIRELISGGQRSE